MFLPADGLTDDLLLNSLYGAVISGFGYGLVYRALLYPKEDGVWAVLSAGVTDTPAARKIPGSEVVFAEARRRNPGGRLTEPDDVARGDGRFDWRGWATDLDAEAGADLFQREPDQKPRSPACFAGKLDGAAELFDPAPERTQAHPAARRGGHGTGHESRR